MNVKKVVVILFTSLWFVAGAQSNKLVVSSFYPVDSSAGWDATVKKFQETHPDVEIEVQVTPFDQYLAKLVTQVAGNTPPDIVAVENNPFPQFVNRGILEDLTPYLEASTGFSLESFFPRLIDRYTVDGKVYGIPYDAQPFAMLFYNPALFDEAGLDYPTDTWTWADLLAAATKLTKKDAQGNVSQYGLDVADTWAYFLYGGGGALVDDVHQPTKSLLNTPESIEALQFYVDLMYKNEVTPGIASIEALGGNDAHATLFTTGKTAMYVDGFWRLVFDPQSFADIGADMALAPVKDVENRVYPTGGTAYAIMKASRNKELAWEFIQMFLGQAGYEAAYEAAPFGAIYPPAHIPSFEWYSEQKPPIVSSLEPNRRALDYVRFSPFLLSWSEISLRCIDAAIDLILRNEAPVEPTMNRIAECVNSELANQ